MRHKWLVAPSFLLLLAFALRVFWLTRHPLWWDEGLNVYFAHQSLAALLSETRITHDANPLVYRLALGGWERLVGWSAFSLRLFSAFMGTTAIALTWALGRWLTNGKTTLLATLLVALSPMQIHYSREVKGYAFALACALLSTYTWGRKLGYLQFSSNAAKPQRGPWWILYVLSTTAALGAHYYLGLVVLWQGLWVLARAGLALARKSGPRRETLVQVGAWALAIALAALILAPWLLAVLDTTTEMVAGISVGEPLSVWGYLGLVINTFGGGPGETGPPPGDLLALPLRWRALDTLDGAYTVFVHLGPPASPPLAQSDGPPQNGLSPTSTWVAGQQVLDRHVLTLPDDVPPGRYPLTVGLYRPSDGRRLPGGDGDSLLLGYVEVEP